MPSQCSHGIHAHVDAQSAVINQLLSNECFAFVQKMAETCTCSARLTDHVPILNPYRTINRSLPPNTTPTAPAYGNEPEGQPRLGFPMYASVGVTPVWSSSVTLLPFSVSSVPLPPSSITNAHPSSTNAGDPSPTSMTSSSLQSPATPDPSPLYDTQSVPILRTISVPTPDQLQRVKGLPIACVVSEKAVPCHHRLIPRSRPSLESLQMMLLTNAIRLMPQLNVKHTFSFTHLDSEGPHIFEQARADERLRLHYGFAFFHCRPDLQLPIADLKRERIHSCYPDTILACLPFFWRNIGRAPNSDLSEHPPFLQCRIATSRPRLGRMGQAYRTLCPQNSYSDDLTDSDDEDENVPPSPCLLAQLMDVDEESIQAQASTSPIDDLAYPASDHDVSEVNESEPIRDPQLSRMLPSIQFTAGPPPFESWQRPSNTTQIYDAQRRVQRDSSSSLLSDQYLRIKARTPAEAGRAIHMCLVKLYKRCFHLDTGMYLDGVADESDFPWLPIVDDIQPPNHWNNLQSYSDLDLRIHADHAEDTATGLGVNIQVHAALVEYILDSPRYTDSCFGKYKIPAFPSRVYNQSDLAVWRADGAAFSLYAACMGFPLNDLHPAFLLTLLPPPGQDPLKYLGDLTGPILQLLDRRLCDSIRPWFYLAPTDPIGNTLGDPVPQALIGLQTQFQAHHIGLRRSRTLQEHVMQTQDLISELVIGNTTFWQTEAFQQMHQGFHQAFNEMLPELTIPRAFTGASCGPLNAITYVYDCEPRTPTELFDYIGIGPTPVVPVYPGLRHNFQTELFLFLSEDIERSKVLLYVMSGSTNLPRWEQSFQLKFEFKALAMAGSSFVHACTRRADISWDSITDTILSGSHGEITPKAWLEAMFTGVAGYSMLVELAAVPLVLNEYTKIYILLLKFDHLADEMLEYEQREQTISRCTTCPRPAKSAVLDIP
ncbi:hypothetical protein F5146DRAFT_1144006 [Armillaria mellea]|nr:hypothetical protein F5146DRAFT_1144006 [Armillaria mellea]